jgi:hypothetical protein
MSNEHEIRRLRDGSIDFNFYRRRAATLRTQLICETLMPKGKVNPALWVAALAAAAAAAVAWPGDVT